MKKKLTLFLMLVVTVLSFYSCNNDDDKKSNTENLCDKDMEVTAVTASPGIDIGGGVIITDLYNNPIYYQDCSKDDFINFKTNGTYLEDEGATKCLPTDPQTENGTWEWNSDETVLTITQPDSTDYSYLISKNDGTTLIGSSVQDFGGDVQTITTTYKKK